MKRTPLQRKTPLRTKSWWPRTAPKTFGPPISNRRSMKTRVSRPNAQQHRWRELVRSMGSIISGLPAEIHHPVGRTGKHNGIHIGHWWLIPLTRDEHQGPEGIHSHPDRRVREKELFLHVLHAAIDRNEGRPPECFPPADVLKAIGDWHQ